MAISACHRLVAQVYAGGRRFGGALAGLPVLQQLDTPGEIYNRPANTYVATFMGSPTMNLIAARAGGTRAPGQFGIENAVLPLHSPSQAPGTLLGVRPEHLQLVADSPWRGEVSWFDGKSGVRI